MSEVSEFDRLTSFIEAELAFATSHYNDSYLRRRFASRMRRRDVECYSEYRSILEDDPEERQALLDALSINVTGFFRNPDVWEGVRSLLRRLTDDYQVVSVWSAGCADGREPYSVSMLALDDPEIDADSVRITATDINRSALEAAREGVYSGSRTVDIDDELQFLSNYFRYVERDGDTYRIRDRVKQPVRFQHHDLINDEPKAEFHLVLCRNLFIYIDSEYKVPVLETVADSLRTRGYLVIGKAETVPSEVRDGFDVVDSRLRIYRRR